MKNLSKRVSIAIIGASLLAFSLSALAVPANPTLQTFKQPNGTSIQGRMAGDESMLWMETTAGDVFLFNKKSGLYEYAVVEQTNGKSSLAPSGIAVGSGPAPALVNTPGITTKFVVNALWKEARKPREEMLLQKQKEALKLAPGTGMQSLALASSALPDVPLIMIMVDFTDYKFKSPDSTWQQKIFGNAEGTVNDYYREISNGRFKFVPAAESQGTANDGVVHVSLNYPHPNPANMSWPDDYYAYQRTLIDALRQADQHINFSQFDKNGDGYADTKELSIIFVWAGNESGPNPNVGVHAHGNLFNADKSLSTFDNTLLRYYVVFGERFKDGTNPNDPPAIEHDTSMGVIAHEIGHLTFSLLDLYDSETNYSVIDIMGDGAWGMKTGDPYQAMTPPHMSAFSKLQAGFITPTEIDLMYAPTNMSLLAPKNTSYNVAKVLTNVENEFFLVEQRRLEGYDRGMTLDSSLYGKYGVMMYRQNYATDHANRKPGTQVVRANEDTAQRVAFKLEDMFYPGYKTSLTPTTSPNSKINGVNVGVVIENIASTTDAMTLRFRHDDQNGYNCKQYAATNSAHVTASRAYSTTTGSFFKTTTYYAKGSAQSLGTSGTTNTTLKETPAGYFSKGTCTQTNQKPVVTAITSTASTSSTTVTIEVSDAERDLVRVEYQVDGGAWIKAFRAGNPTQGNFFYPIIFNRLTSGNHQISARANDAAGNVSAVFGPVSFTAPAQSAPTCRIDNVKKDADAYWVAYGSTNDVDNDFALLDVRVDGGAWKRVGRDPQGLWDVRISAYPDGNPNGLAQGAHTVEARGTDAGGRTGSCGPVNFSVGAASAPEIKNVTSGFRATSVNINGNATDLDGDVAGLDYDVDGNGNWKPAENFSIDGNHTASFGIAANNISVGQRAFRLRAHDAAGHFSAFYTVNINLPAATAPSCSLSRVFYDSPSNSYYLEGSFADVNNDASSVEMSLNQTDWLTVNVMAADFQAALPNQPLANDNYTAYGRVKDEGGLSSICGPLSFSISGYGNPPTVGTPSAAVSGLNVTVSGTATDPDSNLSVVEVQFDSDTATIANATGTTSWSFANSTLAAGAHKVHARAKDSTGNYSAWSSWVNFTLAASPSCFTATNSAHVTAGRATVKYTSLYYAVGSNTYLGGGATTTSLKLSSPNNWAKVTSCP